MKFERKERASGIKVKTQRPRSCFAAVESRNTAKVIAEGVSVSSVIKKAEKTGVAFSLTYILQPNRTYVF